MKKSSTIVCLTTAALLAHAAGAVEPSFQDFDRRAQAGEQLTVVFFGASLTWGANATDQGTTSYRARMAEHFEEQYPKAHFHFYDGAIGGTGSQLGVFRVERDVLRRKPDLVFLDFSANDDIYSDAPDTLASYEAIVRRLIVEAHVPVVPVIFPFKWNVTGGSTDGMKRRDAHLAIGKAYGTVCGDAITLCIERIKAGQTTADAIWDTDGVHPGDAGYRIFAQAAWDAYLAGVKGKLVCHAPEKMLYADTYMTSQRARLTELYAKPGLPAGWQVGKPSVTGAFFDMQMSRWLDNLLVTAPAAKEAVKDAKDAKDKPVEVTPPASLRLTFRGGMVLLFGESSPTSGKYRVLIDGKAIEHTENKATTDVFNAGYLGKLMGRAVHLTQVITTGLDPAVEHSMEIVPVLNAGEELRIESVCVAGGEAKVQPAK